MRRSFPLFILALLAACSGSTPTTNTPPPIVARVLIAAQSIAASGGTLRYTKAGDPLDGLTITVPAGAFTTATQWTITADSTIVVPVPAGFAMVGPALEISNGQGYAKSAITLTMPMVVGAGFSVAPFYFDRVTKQFEGIPMVDRTATSATLAAEHFSGDFTATGAATQAAVRSGRAFGDVIVVWFKVANSDLKGGPYTTNFHLGRDEWEFTNYGDYLSPEGDCEGMSVTALYYSYFVSKGASFGLYHQYDLSIPNKWDNVQGIRFAGAVQSDFDTLWRPNVNQVKALVDMGIAKGASAAALTPDWIVLTLKLAKAPVLMGLFGPAGGHAVIAYSATSTGPHTEVSFADPNFPDSLRIMIFDAGVLTPIQLQLNANDPTETFTKAYALGVTADVPLNMIDARYAEFKTHTAGHDRYPSAYTWGYSIGGGSFSTITGVIETSNKSFLPVLMCPGCTAKAPGANPVDRQGIAVYDSAGAIQVDVNGFVTLVPGLNQFVLVGFPNSPFSPTKATGFLDSKTIFVNYTVPSVALSMSSPSITMIAGGSGPNTVTISRTVFTGAVTLTDSADNGITMVANPSPTAGDTSTLTFTALPSVGLGTHLITVMANGLNIPEARTTFNLVVTSASQYTLLAGSPSVAVHVNSIVTNPVTITRNGTFTGGVTVTGVADSANITVTTSPTSGNQVTLSVNAGPGASVGAHTITVTGVAAGQLNVPTTFLVIVSLGTAQTGIPTGIFIMPLSATVHPAETQLFTAYLVDAAGNRTLPEAGWGISILSDSSKAATDLADQAFDFVQRWDTRTLRANQVWTTPVRAAYFRLSDGFSTFVAIGHFVVVP